MNTAPTPNDIYSLIQQTTQEQQPKIDPTTIDYIDTLIIDGIPHIRIYVPVYDDTCLYEENMPPKPLLYNTVQTITSGSHFLMACRVETRNMKEKTIRMYGKQILVVECKIPVGAYLVHDPHELMTAFLKSDTSPTKYSRMWYIFHIGDMDQYNAKVYAMDYIWKQNNYHHVPNMFAPIRDKHIDIAPEEYPYMPDSITRLLSYDVRSDVTRFENLYLLAKIRHQPKKQHNTIPYTKQNELSIPQTHISANAPTGTERNICTVVGTEDDRDAILEHVENKNFYERVRKPLCEFPREYKQGVSAYPILFRTYLKYLIHEALRVCKPSLRERLYHTEKRTTKGRKPLKLEEYTFCFIDKIETKRDNLQYEGIMRSQLVGVHIEKFFTTNSYIKYTGRNEFSELLQLMIELSSRMFQRYERIFAIDSSGFRGSTKNDYYAEKHHVKKEQIWCDAHIIVGVNSNVATAAIVAPKYSLDELDALPYLVERTQRNFRMSVLLGDGGYLSAKAMKEINEKYEVTLYAPLKKNSLVCPHGKCEEWNDNVDFNLSDLWERFYHARSNVETTFNCIKRLTGETISAKREQNMFNELYAKILINNIHLQIIYYFVAHIFPDYIPEGVIKENVETH